ARTGRKATGLPTGSQPGCRRDIDGRGCGLFNEPQKEHPGHGLEPLVRRAPLRAIATMGVVHDASAALGTSLAEQLSTLRGEPVASLPAPLLDVVVRRVACAPATSSPCFPATG